MQKVRSLILQHLSSRVVGSVADRQDEICPISSSKLQTTFQRHTETHVDLTSTLKSSVFWGLCYNLIGRTRLCFRVCWARTSPCPSVCARSSRRRRSGASWTMRSRRRASRPNSTSSSPGELRSVHISRKSFCCGLIAPDSVQVCHTTTSQLLLLKPNGDLHFNVRTCCLSNSLLILCLGQVYKGYSDDPRNTDNAWIETRAVNFHDEDGHILSNFRIMVRHESEPPRPNANHTP